MRDNPNPYPNPNPNPNPSPSPNPNPNPDPNQVSDKVGLATELMYYHNQLCTFGVGYEFRLRQATVVRV